MNPQDILGPNNGPIGTLISDLMTPSNEQRSQAASLFVSCIQTDPITLATKLVHLLEHSPDIDVLGMSAILLRKTLLPEPTENRPTLWIWLAEMLRSRVQSCLLNCVRNEDNEPIIIILCNTISDLAADNRFPEIIPFMFDVFKNVELRTEWLKKSALHIFAKLGEQYVEGYLVPHQKYLHGVFMNCLGEGDADFRITALSAVINFIQCLDYGDRRSFKDLLPRMLQCVNAAFNPDKEATAQKALVLLFELAGTKSNFFTGWWPNFLEIAEAESLEEGTSHLAIEFVITSAESKKCDFPQPIINWLCEILMRRLLDIEDEAAWHSAENEDEDAGWSSNNIFGKECLHRLATTLGGNTIVPVAYKYLSAPNHEWQKHLAGLVALAQIEGHSKLEIPNLEQVVTVVLNSFESHPDHPRVRWAAINAIEQLSTCVGPSLPDQYHNRVLRALDSALDDVQNPRVQACAASAVFKIEISATCPTQILEPYLDGILSKLIVLPQTGRNIEVLRLANSLKESLAALTRDRLAILLGEMFEEPLAALTKHLVKYILLKCVKEERERSVLKRLCHTIAMFYNAFCVETGWPELICFVEQCVVSGSGQNLRSVLKRLGHTIAMFYNAFCMKTGWPELICFVELCVVSGLGQNLSYNDLLEAEAEAAMLILGPLGLFMKCHPESLVMYYVRYLENTNSTDIRIAAFGAAIGYIRCTYKVMDGRLVPAMTRMLTEGLNEGEEVTTQKALELLIEWAHQIKHPWFSKSSHTESYDRISYDIGSYFTESYDSYFSGRQLVGFVSSAIEITESQCLKETKHLAIDFMITLVEGKDDFMITLGEGRDSHHELMTNKLFGILISDIENEAVSHWAENEDDDAWELRNCSVVLKFLDRLAFRLDKDSDSWCNKLEQYLGANWEKRVIAINILALAQISKVYLKVTKKSFDQLVTMVLDLFQDSHYRVKLAAIHATCQLSTDLDPDLQLQYHRLMLPALANAIGEDPDSRVRLAAINATRQLFTALDPHLQFDQNHCGVLKALAKAIREVEYPQVQELAASAVINVIKNFNLFSRTPDLIDIVEALLEFRGRDDSASYKTRSPAIKDIVKLFPPGTWSQLGLGFDVEE